MKTVYIISDLHLNINDEKSIYLFQKFLNKISNKKHENIELYILGDFFDYWIGYDIADKSQIKIMNILKDFTESNLIIYFMVGNRDFLINNEFYKYTGCIKLQDPFIFEYFSEHICLTHGDLLCTTDKSYLRYRFFSRFSIIKKIFLMLPKNYRKSIANNLRAKSKKKFKNNIIIDVTNEGIKKHCESKYLIHGHTHQFKIFKENKINRYVLGDWHDGHGSCILINKEFNNDLSIKLLGFNFDNIENLN